MKIQNLNSFKEKFKFLEFYGFQYSNDPYRNRPCYKNKFGEIVVGKEEGLFNNEMNFYVQIMGRKIDINIEEEYKTYIKDELLKSKEKMFESLFKYHVEKSGTFYGLCITNSPYKLKDELDLDLKIENDPYIMKSKNKFTILFIVFLFIITIISIFSNVLIYEFKSDSVVYVFKIIRFFSILIVNTFLIGYIKKGGFFSKFLLIAYPMFLLYGVFQINKRTEMKIYLLSFLVAFIYLIYAFLKSVYKKNKKYIIMGLLSIIYPAFTLMIESFVLNKYVHFIQIDSKIFIYLSIVFIFVLIFAFFKLRKKIQLEKNKIGIIFGIIMGVAIITFAIPYLSISNINYAFDTSKNEYEEFIVIDKLTTFGYKSRRRVLIVRKHNDTYELSVNPHEYYNYNIGDSLTLSYEQGFLGYNYIELIE